jgi:hypothetical protein
VENKKFLSSDLESKARRCINSQNIHQIPDNKLRKKIKVIYAVLTIKEEHKAVQMLFALYVIASTRDIPK